MSGSTPSEADRPGSDVDSDYAFEAVPLTAPVEAKNCALARALTCTA